ncbi:unnamed protein product [Chrysodeixis includens]|uniref:Cuticle protein n=1 Tax=Chrysodeixis includens TaxID=689277 RepID=A0A9P0FSB8_CHRIL|nr:unnamed protein product [Chrysodeixis includens]
MYKLVVLFSVLAVVAAKPSGLSGLGLGAPWAAAALGLAAPVAPLAAPLLAAPVGIAGPAVVAAPLAAAAVNYRGPVSLAPGQPASILAADGRPLDTLSVNADRAVHYTAKAVDHATVAAGHLLGKRSAPLLSPVALSAPAQLAWLAPLAPLAPLAVGPLAQAGLLGQHW